MMHVNSVNELVNKIDRFPILIISSPRTGSTLLLNKLKFLMPRISTFYEPEQSVKTLNSFVTMYNSKDQNYAVKSHSSYILRQGFHERPAAYPSEIVTDFVNSDRFFKILVKRKDMAAQVASLYVAEMRDRWFYNSEYSHPGGDTIEIRPDKIANIIHKLNIFEQDFLVFKNIDCVICYEDFKDDGVRVGSTVTPPPSNYNKLLETIRAML